MDDREFQTRAEELFVEVEDRIDELELDVDIDSSGGVLTLTMENGTQVILSRQPASHEIWVAARSGGFHLADRDGVWVCGTTDETLAALLNRVFTEQVGEPVTLLDDQAG